MSNLFKEAIKFMTLRVRNEKTPLSYELQKETVLTEKEKGKNGVLGTSKLEKTEGDEEIDR